MAIPSTEQAVACEFCGNPLTDRGLAFLEHLDRQDTCKWLWRQQRGFLKTDAGSE